MHKKPNRLLLFIQGFLMLHIIWYLAYLFTNTTVIPNPLMVYKKFPQALSSGIFLHIAYSLRRIAIGLVLSLVVGIIIGISMAYVKKINKLLFPLIYFSYPIPKTALLPVAMLLLGMRDLSKIAIIFLIIVFQVIVSVRDSVNAIDESVYHVLRTTGANTMQIIRHVTIPAILPSLLTDLRISLGTAVSILFFVESYGTKYGMGYYIMDAWSRIQYDEMYLGILIISVVGFLLFSVIDYLGDKLER